MDVFWDYFSVLAPSVGLALIFWLVMRSVFRVDTGERSARAELEEQEAREWARRREAASPEGTVRGSSTSSSSSDDQPSQE